MKFFSQEHYDIIPEEVEEVEIVRFWWDEKNFWKKTKG